MNNTIMPQNLYMKFCLADNGGLSADRTDYISAEIIIITANKAVWRLLHNTMQCDNISPVLLNAKVNAKQEA